jgi:hypothetical protein
MSCGKEVVEVSAPAPTATPTTPPLVVHHRREAQCPLEVEQILAKVKTLDECLVGALASRVASCHQECGRFL